MKVYCCQLDIAWEDKEANYGQVHKLLQASRPEPGSLIVLPEMFATGFSMNVAAIAEAETGATESFVAALAREFGCSIVAGVVTKPGKGANQAVVYGPEGLLARYTKIHPFSLGGELEHYERGRGIAFFEWQGLKVAPLVCYDLRFPELFRTAVQGGAEMFVVIANWPSKREQHWVTLLQARAIENLAFVVGVNRAGRDPQHVYPGRTMVVNPHGEILVDAGAEAKVVRAEIEPAVVRSWRQQFPALRDMHWGIH